MTNPESRLKETTFSTETIFEGRVFNVRREEVELPDGRNFTREIVAHPGAAAAVALDGDDVLMVRQWRHAVREVLLELPAGTREEGEGLEETMRRELPEETGHSAGRLEHLADIYPAPGYTSEVISIFLATDLAPAEAKDDVDEQIEVVRVPFEEAVRQCLTGELHDAKTIAGLLLTAARLQG